MEEDVSFSNYLVVWDSLIESLNRAIARGDEKQAVEAAKELAKNGVPVRGRINNHTTSLNAAFLNADSEVSSSSSSKNHHHSRINEIGTATYQIGEVCEYFSCSTNGGSWIETRIVDVKEERLQTNPPEAVYELDVKPGVSIEGWKLRKRMNSMSSNGGNSKTDIDSWSFRSYPAQQSSRVRDRRSLNAIKQQNKDRVNEKVNRGFDDLEEAFTNARDRPTITSFDSTSSTQMQGGLGLHSPSSEKNQRPNSPTVDDDEALARALQEEDNAAYYEQIAQQMQKQEHEEDMVAFDEDEKRERIRQKRQQRIMENALRSGSLPESATKDLVFKTHRPSGGLGAFGLGFEDGDILQRGDGDTAFQGGGFGLKNPKAHTEYEKDKALFLDRNQNTNAPQTNFAQNWEKGHNITDQVFKLNPQRANDELALNKKAMQQQHREAIREVKRERMQEKFGGAPRPVDMAGNKDLRPSNASNNPFAGRKNRDNNPFDVNNYHPNFQSIPEQTMSLCDSSSRTNKVPKGNYNQPNIGGNRVNPMPDKRTNPIPDLTISPLKLDVTHKVDLTPKIEKPYREDREIGYPKTLNSPDVSPAAVSPALVSPSPTKEQVEIKKTCPLCFEEYSSMDLVHFEYCDHFLCEEDFVSLLKDKITDGLVQEEELCCPIPDCKISFSLDQIELHLRTPDCVPSRVAKEQKKVAEPGKADHASTGMKKLTTVERIERQRLWDRFLEFRLKLFCPQSGKIQKCPRKECGADVIVPSDFGMLMTMQNLKPQLAAQDTVNPGILSTNGVPNPEDTQDLIPTPVNCPYCNHPFCPACGKIAHEGISCKENRRKLESTKTETEKSDAQQMEDLLIQENWARCPVCHIIVERESGCNFMQCPSAVCRNKTFFCYVCGDLVPKVDHYNHYQKGPYEDYCVTRPEGVKGKQAVYVPTEEELEQERAKEREQGNWWMNLIGGGGGGGGERNAPPRNNNRNNNDHYRNDGNDNGWGAWIGGMFNHQPAPLNRNNVQNNLNNVRNNNVQLQRRILPFATYKGYDF